MTSKRFSLKRPVPISHRRQLRDAEYTKHGCEGDISFKKSCFVLSALAG